MRSIKWLPRYCMYRHGRQLQAFDLWVIQEISDTMINKKLLHNSNFLGLVGAQYVRYIFVCIFLCKIIKHNKRLRAKARKGEKLRTYIKIVVIQLTCSNIYESRLKYHATKLQFYFSSHPCWRDTREHFDFQSIFYRTSPVAMFRPKT